jgi:hypothetical protein
MIGLFIGFAVASLVFSSIAPFVLKVKFLQVVQTSDIFLVMKMTSWDISHPHLLVQKGFHGHLTVSQLAILNF